MKPQIIALCILALALCFLPAAAGAEPIRPTKVSTTALAITFPVNSNADDVNAHDWFPGDGLCVDASWRCTLRAAIEEANAWPGADTITFNNSMYISLDPTEGALPSITEQLRIDASSAWNITDDRPGVTVNGGNKSFTGLLLSANNCEVYGLFLINFTNAIDIRSAYNTVGAPVQGQWNVISSNGSNGVSIYGTAAHHNVVSGNWIGLSITGDTKQPNDNGVHISGGAWANTIGGDTLGKGNVISGNTYQGVAINGANSDGNRLGANWIGLPAVGSSQDVGNGAAGVYVDNGPQNTLIGDSGGSVAGNFISFNGNTGVIIWGADGNWVETNVITGNKVNGVHIQNGAGNYILSNEIASNIQDGVSVSGATATGNAILGNSIHHNGYKGIRLVDGGNTGLAAPTITTANAGGASGTGCAGCTVHLFSDTADEGETYQGFANVGGSGNWSFVGALTGPNVTATNTDAGSNTSEFSAPKCIRCLYLPLITRSY